MTERARKFSGHARSAIARRSRVAFLALATLAALTVAPRPAAAQLLDLRELFPALLRDGIVLAPPTTSGTVSHEAHFTAGNSPQLRAIQQMNDQIASWVATTPISSSAGGFAYELDPELGVLSRPTQSFGSIYAERPLTVGRGKFNVGVNFSRFTFDKFDDVALRTGELALVFTHEDSDDNGTVTPAFEGDVVTARVSMRAESEVTTLVASYGAHDRLDFAVALPVARVRLDVAAQATVQRLSTADDSRTHEFPNGAREQTISRTGESEGIGDITVRAKYLLYGNGDAYVGVATDVQLPTGEERDLLGSGSAQAQLSLTGMMNRYPVSPHFNLGYRAAGGAPPNEVSYALGVDIVADQKLTIAADLIGQLRENSGELEIRDQEFVYNTTLNENDPPVFETATFPFATLVDAGTRNIMSGSVGMKVNFFQNMLLTANGLFPINAGGLRDDFATLVGIDYSF
ncbi:MAG: transporter [bacterium]